MEPAILSAVTSGVATISLCNPAKRNAMTPDMWRALPPLLSSLAEDSAVRALVLTGEGDTFCAGADIGSIRSGIAPRELTTDAEEALAAFPKPTVAAIRGHAVGGGCQLAAACDLRFAEEGARFGVTPARLGIVYPATSTARLRRLVGPSTTKFLLYSAELIGTERALRCGLVDEVLPAGTLEARVAEFTATLAARSRLTQRAAKEFTDRPIDPERVEHWRRQEESTAEVAEGVAAFLERRPPRFGWDG
ncbi:enoyl-CoA hydratase/isomerase family protein [Streptomyces sp. SM14]|uniref:enoyl-CoA hydratase/isomerase family protein n=1 Tax=Streptomyces sp. SM14 TaxID=1736045 RepID=UPI000CD4D9CE|nr:enoyl-CoA hydratase/isomerase family protein [Streptomyces sp. SM14]